MINEHENMIVVFNDRFFKALDNPKVDAVVGLFIYGMAWAFAGAIFAHLKW